MGQHTSSRCAYALLLGSAIGISGCADTQAPVSDRPVADYRRQRTDLETAVEAKRQPDSSTSTEVQAVRPALRPAQDGANKSASKPSTPGSSLPNANASATVEEGDWRPEFYTVKRGDTLYAIALDHGLDYKELSAWNQLTDPNLIRVEQQLRLRAPAGWKPEPSEAEAPVSRPLMVAPAIEAQPLDPPPATKADPKGIKVRYSDQALAQLLRDPAAAPAADLPPPLREPKPEARPATLPAPTPTAPKILVSAAPATLAPVPKPEPAATVAASPPPKLDDPAGTSNETIQWIWPASGKLLHAFNQGSNAKGVAIAGNAGQPVVASAAGKVVYSGSGLRGYGKLIIIKHNNTYLSVYAHNRELLVREGQRVNKGQKIAEMGNSDTNRIALHFEIRRLGKPVDPLRYLPQEGA